MRLFFYSLMFLVLPFTAQAQIQVQASRLVIWCQNADGSLQWSEYGGICHNPPPAGTQTRTIDPPVISPYIKVAKP